MPESPADHSAAMAMFSTLQERAAAADITLRSPPLEPTTCCGRGCNGCVWEGWYAAVAYWREDAEEAISNTKSGSSPIPTSATSY